MAKVEIIVRVSGGVVTDVENPDPDNIDIIVRDYDNGGEELLEDEYGEYVQSIH